VGNYEPRNYDYVNRGFDLLLQALAPYVGRELIRVYAQDWWRKGVVSKVSEMQRQDLPPAGKPSEVLVQLDVAVCLRLLDTNWNEVFRARLSKVARSWANELGVVRNDVAHRSLQDLSNDDAEHNLDVMARLAEALDAGPRTGEGSEGGNFPRASKVAGDIRTMLRELRDAAVPAPVEQPPAPTRGGEPLPVSVGARDLPAWRAVMQPNADVMEGRYSKAEFAADLDKVAKGEAELEYQDPVEFFNRTYVTAGMKSLLVQALRRVAGTGGEPVIQLKTTFGGGKTHSMLALYHLLRGRAPLEQIPSLAPVLEQAGVAEVPQVNVAVVVGTVPNPATYRQPAELPGVRVNTLWGEIAAQLAVSAGRPELYDYVRDADRRGVAPGKEALQALFDDCGPCLVLVDELVAYARKLWKKDDAKLPAGTFGNLLTFVQELTEAATASRNSLVVASIPESDNEIGGDGGRAALEQIEHTFARLESIWQPVAHDEGFEVVRRRLFRDCADPDARSRVCRGFSAYYQQNAADFPAEAHELAYERRMEQCYPIHPEVFDRLYEDWATLPSFQRTRGVLRFMAGVIHRLWTEGDQAPMIMPGSIPLSGDEVRDELVRYLPDTNAWSVIVTADVDGEGSTPLRVDRGKARYGSLMAARRTARAVFLGSAPDVAGQTARGIERSRVLLGVAQPGEPLATFHDAIGDLARSASYINTDAKGERYWYDVRPNLNRMVEDRARQVTDDAARALIERRMGRPERPEPFSGIHTNPASSADVPDEKALRLVVLPYAQPYHKLAGGANPAEEAARTTLLKRGEAARAYRNTLVFLAADHVMVPQAVQYAKQLIAWESARDGADDLNLTKQQRQDVGRRCIEAERNLDGAVGSMYCWLLVPFAARDAEAQPPELELRATRLNGSALAEQVRAAARSLCENGDAVVAWAPRMLALELAGVLWGDAGHIEAGKLWECLCRYCYLPRLASYDVLAKAVREGAASDGGYFALARDVDGDGRYVDLRFKAPVAEVSPTDLVVRPEVAQEQLAREAEARAAAEEERRREAGSGADVGSGTGGSAPWGGGPGADGANAGPNAVGANAGDNPNAGGSGGNGGPNGPGASGSWGAGSGNAPWNGSATAGGAGNPGVSGANGAAGAAPAPRHTRISLSADLDAARASRDFKKLDEEILEALQGVPGAKLRVTVDIDFEVPDGVSAQVERTVTENCRTLGIGTVDFW
jgi:hypothetical protein